MKFRTIFQLEFTNQVRSVSTWLIFGILGFFAFEPAVEDFIRDAQEGEHFLNAPFVIAVVTAMGCLLWLLVAAVIAGKAAARDVETGMHPLTYTAPVSKVEYLGGRFMAALFLNACILLALTLGFLLTVYVRGLEPEILGPFRPEAYLTAYLYIALPNVFIATAIQFSFSILSRNTMASYFGSLLLFAVTFILPGVVTLLLNWDAEHLLDPLGFMTVLSGDLTNEWSVMELNTRLITLEGPLLTNRLLWLGLALVVLEFTYLRFSFAHPAVSTWWSRFKRRRGAHLSMPTDFGIARSTPVSVPQVALTFGFPIQVRQTLAIAWSSYRNVIKSHGGLIPFAVILLLTLGVGQMSHFNVSMFPRTEHVIYFILDAFTEPPFVIFIPLFISFYAGEIIWRERDANLSEITDAVPVPEWILFLGKFLSLGLVLVTWMTLLTAAGILGQVRSDYYDLEIGLYLQIFFGLQLIDYILFALLALVIHVLVNQKYLGHLIVFLAYVFFGALAYAYGIEHKLLVFNADTGWSYTDLRGYGPFLEPWLWYKLYWAAWALLLAVAARLLWVRGRESGFGARLQLMHRRFTDATAGTAAVAVGLILILGGYIFYNTNVLNEYRTSSKRMKQRAEYERRYKRYDSVPQPRLTRVHLNVEIYPGQREAKIRSSYHLVNGSTVAIDTVHIATSPAVETGALAFDRPARKTLADKELGHRIYALDQPLQPGDSLRLDFAILYKPKGFRNNGVDASVGANGTFFTNQDWLPAIGYQPQRELSDEGIRREHGLAPRPRIPSLYEVDARQQRPGTERIAFEAVVGTDEDQIAVAPGTLQRTWTVGGRRYFHYSTDAPIGDQYAFFSANYAVHDAQWNPSADPEQAVAIQIYHHPGHTQNLDRMVRSVQASMDYFTDQFEPYEYGYLRLIERHGHGLSLHAEASTIDYQEGYSLLNPDDDANGFDLQYAVMAHEMAHQFGAGYAYAEGAGLITESLAWYSAMMVVKQTYGHDHLRRLLSWMRGPFPHQPVRATVPLLQAAESYLSYRKGPFALYALSEYMGEERVNRAIRHFYEKHSPETVPPPTSLDFYRELQAVTPDSLKPLLHDLFEVNTFWELETSGAAAEQTETGTWQVTVEVEARKVAVDTAGVETELPMDDWIEVGVFAPAEPGHHELSQPLYLQKHRIRSGTQTITVTVPGKPVLVGIDPYHLLDWEELADDDNMEEVQIEN